MTMTRSIKTNPAYAYLAYRRAIVQDIIAHLQNSYLGGRGDDPQRKILSDEVFHVDAEVPREEIENYVGELMQKDAHLELEMAKFEFSKKDEDEQKAEKGAGGGKAKGGEARGKGQRSSDTH